ncbi:hypothetical protein [Nocardiopsis metallicus]|uniref:Uncharacterized protein n=1 Tax=Nocardiopsis metallicus TaxID=179819 RepID=A0A840W7W3_9ACTN|nr:hypothetical protein [Nocardiopsis metallicus]MBB5493130.1 hypothetical protein [Nocardiopsis metallicus]
MTTNTTTAPEPPERGSEEAAAKPEPFKLSDAEIQGIVNATGVRSDLVSMVRGDSYDEVKTNAAKLADMHPDSTVDPTKPFPHKHETSKIGIESDEVSPKAIAAAIWRRLGYGSAKRGK